MTTTQAAAAGWIVAEPVVSFLMVIAAFLLGFALLREITR